MQLTAARETGIASLPRRAAACMLDVAILLPAVAGAGVAAFKVTQRSGRSPGWWREIGSDPDWGKRWHPRVISLSAGLALVGRNWRTPGMRIVGVRRVDACTGGLVRLRSALVRTAVDTVLAQLGRELNRPVLEGWEANRLAANDEIERMRESRPDADPEELLQDSLEIQRRHKVSGNRLARRAVAHAATLQLAALWSRRRQTLTQRLAGTIIIDDR